MLYVCRVRSRSTRARGGLLVPLRLGPPYRPVKERQPRGTAEPSRRPVDGAAVGPAGGRIRGRVGRSGRAVRTRPGRSRQGRPARPGRCPRPPAPRGPPGPRARAGSPCGRASRPAGGPGPAGRAGGCAASRRPTSARAVRSSVAGSRVATASPAVPLVDAAAAELGGERPAGEPAPGVPGAHPRLRERPVVDEPDLGEPPEHRLRRLRRHPAPGQRRRQLGPGPRLAGQQSQADRPGHRLRVAREVLRVPGRHRLATLSAGFPTTGSICPAPPSASRTRRSGGRTAPTAPAAAPASPAGRRDPRPAAPCGPLDRSPTARPGRRWSSLRSRPGRGRPDPRRGADRRRASP